jgi:hypothetical protein
MRRWSGDIWARGEAVRGRAVASGYDFEDPEWGRWWQVALELALVLALIGVLFWR